MAIAIGQRFGRLLVITRTSKKGHDYNWLCLCDCGNQKAVTGGNLRRTQSCGCFHLEHPSNFRHGHARKGRTTKIRNIWNTMKQRCHNKDDSNYGKYGNRGITVCAGWRNSFESFLQDMGEPPEGLTIDRKDNDKGYWCGHCVECVENRQEANCRWAYYTTQANNKRNNRCYTINNETLTLTQWARRRKLPPPRVRNRIYRGASIEEALRDA